MELNKRKSAPLLSSTREYLATGLLQIHRFLGDTEKMRWYRAMSEEKGPQSAAPTGPNGWWISALACSAAHFLFLVGKSAQLCASRCARLSEFSLVLFFSGRSKNEWFVHHTANSVFVHSSSACNWSDEESVRAIGSWTFHFGDAGLAGLANSCSNFNKIYHTCRTLAASVQSSASEAFSHHLVGPNYNPPSWPREEEARVTPSWNRSGRSVVGTGSAGAGAAGSVSSGGEGVRRGS